MTNVMGIWAFLARERNELCLIKVVYYYFKRSPLRNLYGSLQKEKIEKGFDTSSFLLGWDKSQKCSENTISF